MNETFSTYQKRVKMRKKVIGYNNHDASECRTRIYHFYKCGLVANRYWTAQISNKIMNAYWNYKYVYPYFFKNNVYLHFKWCKYAINNHSWHHKPYHFLFEQPFWGEIAAAVYCMHHLLQSKFLSHVSKIL